MSSGNKPRLRLALFPVFGLLLTIAVVGQTESGLPNGFNKRMMALEFARTQGDVNTLSAGDELKTSLRKALWFDSTVAIPVYWIFFISLAAFLYGHNVFPPKLWLIGLPLVISIAAVADQIENLSMLAAFDMRPGAETIHVAAYIKWAGLGLSCALVGVGLIGGGWRAVPATIAYWGVAIVMANALYTDEPRVEIAFGMMGIAVALTGVALWRRPISRSVLN